MKYIAPLLIALLLSISIKAQKITADKVPAAVTKSFASMYGNTKVTEWEIENGNYEATFTLRGIENGVSYTKDGAIVEFKAKVNASEVPDAAIKYMTTNYPTKKIVDYTRIKNGAGAIKYEIDATDSDYIFDDKGNFLSIEVDEESDDK